MHKSSLVHLITFTIELSTVENGSIINLLDPLSVRVIGPDNASWIDCVMDEVRIDKPLMPIHTLLMDMKHKVMLGKIYQDGNLIGYRCVMEVDKIIQINLETMSVYNSSELDEVIADETFDDNLYVAELANGNWVFDTTPALAE